MPTLAEIRQQFPQYGDMTDSALGDALYSKFYSDIPRNEFDAKVGIAPVAAPAVSVPGGLSVDPAATVPEPAPTTGGTAKASAGGSAAGRIASRAGQVATDVFGDRPFGLSEQSIQELRATGALAPEGKMGTPIQLLNEVVYRFGSKAGDAILRTLGAGVGAIAGGTGQALQEAGVDPGMARRAERDVMAVPPALGGLAPSGGVAAARSRAMGAAERAAPAALTAEETAAAGGAATVKVAAPAGSVEFRQAAKPFYEVLDNSGVVVKAESVQALAQDMFQATTKKGLDPGLTPGAIATLKRVDEIGNQPVTFQTLDIIRQVANRIKPDEGLLRGIIIDKLDKFVDGISKKDLVLGTEAEAQKVAGAVNSARDLWSRAGKLEVVEDLIERAKFGVANRPSLGMENTLRTEFISLAKDKARMAKFSADEREAITKVISGAGKAAARTAGRFAPTGPVSAMATGGIAATLGAKIGLDPITSMVAIGAPAFGARKLAEALTKRSLSKLQETIRQSGGDTQAAAAAVRRGVALLENIK